MGIQLKVLKFQVERKLLAHLLYALAAVSSIFLSSQNCCNHFVHFEHLLVSHVLVPLSLKNRLEVSKYAGKCHLIQNAEAVLLAVIQFKESVQICINRSMLVPI